MWNRLGKPELTNLNTFSERIWAMEQKRPGNFPDFLPNEPLLIFSDYGGSHPGARFESYAFLFVQPSVLPLWEGLRNGIRDAVGFHGGRMAYKKLNAGDRDRALIPWLHAADELTGLLVTIVVENSVGSFFGATDVERLRVEIPEFRDVKDGTIERTFRICHLLSVFVAGVSHPDQELVWITDQDEIAANETRLELLRQTFPKVCGLYLGEPPAKFICATTEADNGSLQIEDLASLPDLVAGAFADVHTQQALHGSLPTNHTPIAIPDSISPKSQYLLHWASLPDRSLRRMVFAFFPAGGGLLHIPKVVFSSKPHESESALTAAPTPAA